MVIIMTLRQEAYQKMEMLPDSSVRLVIALLNEMLSQTLAASKSMGPERTGHDSHADFLDILKFREEHPCPPNFDWEKAREEAMIEKYEHFM